MRLRPWPAHRVPRCLGVRSLALPVRALSLAAFALLAAYLGGALLQTTEGWFMAGISQRMVRNIREGLFDKMQRLPLAYFDTHPHGDIMSRLTNDVDAVSVTVSQSAVQLMSGVVVVAGTLAIMILLSPVMALASLVPVPLVFLLTSTIARRTRVLFKEQQDALGALNGHVEETVSGIQAVKAFGREPEAGRRFAVINEELRRVGTRAQIWTGFLMPMMNVIGNIGFASVAVTGGYLALRGSISVGLIATFISYSRQFVRPLNDIANSYNTLMSAVAGAERVFEVMDEQEEPADTAGASELAQPRGEVEFRDVSFGYRPDVPVLKDVTFTAHGGQRHGHRRQDGRGQDHHRQPPFAFLRGHLGRHPDRRHRHPRTTHAPAFGAPSASCCRTAGFSPEPCGRTSSTGSPMHPRRRCGARRACRRGARNRAPSAGIRHVRSWSPAPTSARARGSSLPLRGRCLPPRGCSCWTRPPARWTPARSCTSSRA